MSALTSESNAMQDKQNFLSGRSNITPSDDPTMDFRARLAHQQAENAERRKLDLAEQSSRLKTAEERIRIWERLHEVTLPRDPQHRLIDIIAANTGLAASDVLEEQRRRADAKLASAAASAAASV
ncbi:MAG: hypothetical protein ABSF94_09575 [Steroidobacteraceae bacterium]